MADKVKITIDGVEREVPANANLLQAILDDGQLIPHFCYHEALGAVGSCRLCACQVAPGADKPARLEMSCMVRVAEGMVVNVKDEYATNFRRQLIEDLMLNHPHDCPVCDEGGECMLQDMTVLSEHQHRRTRFPKRTWVNQNLGPTINHEMNRCITCYRCVRYYRDYALGEDFGVFGGRDRVYFGRVTDGTLESPFSGNLVDVCPTGVFTDKLFRDNYSRPWDLQTARSVCVNCSVGCNVLPGYRHDTLRRIKPAENDAVNKFFICDRGRFGGLFANSGNRINQARIEGKEVLYRDAIASSAGQIKAIVDRYGSGSIAGIGSGRASLESNAALQLLLRGLGGGKCSFYSDAPTRNTVRRAAAITTTGEVPVASLPEIENADVVVILGGDLTAEAPMMDLAVRQAIRAGAQVFIVSPRAGILDRVAKGSLRTVPGEEARIASFVAGATGQSEFQDDNFVHQVAKAIQGAKKPLVLCSACHGDTDLIEAAFNLAKTTAATGSRSCRIAYFFPEANSVGVGLLRADESAETVLAEIESGKVHALLVVEEDAVRVFGKDRFEKIRQKLDLLIVIDSVETHTTMAATNVLPCVSHYQSFGTLVNFEGRAQRFDGMQWSGAVNMAASEVLVSLIQQAGVEESIGGTEFQDVYDVTREASRAMDNIRVGDDGTVVRTAPKLPPARDTPRVSSDPDQLKVWRVIHLYGSEPLSMYTEAIEEQAARPYIEMNPEDATDRKVSEGDEVDFIQLAGVKGPVTFNPGLARGTIAVPVLADIVATAKQQAEVPAGV